MSAPPAVTVAVLTYRRPGDLAAVLPLVLEQLSEAAPEGGRLLVVDNDPDGSGADVVAAVPDQRVRYAAEPVPGIAAARNRALDEAGTPLMVFLDDDERPGRHWLAALLDTFFREQAGEQTTGVVGPVVSEFAAAPDPWLLAGRFFERKQRHTGTVVPLAATNNLLLDLREVRRLGVRFDDRYGLSGGSDTLFTRQLVARGGRLVWCAEAPVVDVVPVHRLTRRWVLRRAFRMGNGTSRVALELAGSPRQRRAVRARQSAHGSARVGVGAVRALMGTVLRSPAHQAGGARQCARGLGMLTGALGHHQFEYRRH